MKYLEFLLIATGGWPEQENPHTTRINALIDYHKILASIEKQQCERKKFHPKRPFMPAVSLTKTDYMTFLQRYFSNYCLSIADYV